MMKIQVEIKRLTFMQIVGTQILCDEVGKGGVLEMWHDVDNDLVRVITETDGVRFYRYINLRQTIWWLTWNEEQMRVPFERVFPPHPRVMGGRPEIFVPPGGLQS
jgi:hypothetical protein